MKNYIILLLIPFLIFSCKNETTEKSDHKDSEKNEIKELSEEKLVVTEEMLKSNTVLIETEFGDIKIKLYNETPKHRENFIKLAAEGYFNGTLFHRVINTFMIQGGDPDSKNAEAGVQLGEGGPDYTIPSEFNDSLFHKKGVIAAAREGDFVNPEKASSGSQFYIVQGVVFNDEDITDVETRQSVGIYIDDHPDYREIINQLQTNNDRAGYEQLIEDIKKKKDYKQYKMPDFKRKIYKEIGGTPHLDNNYTVFGEVTEGLEVIDIIAAVATDKFDRPIKDVKMKITVITE